MSLLQIIFTMRARCFRAKRRPFFTDPPLVGTPAILQELLSALTLTGCVLLPGVLSP